MTPKRLHRQRGQSLLDVLVTLGILGLLAAMTLPEWGAALNRARARRTMADLRALATAIESYAADHQAYPAAACPGDLFAGLPEPLQEKGFSLLEPYYILRVPRKDGWGNAIGYRAVPGGYVLQSRGADGGGFELLRCGLTHDFERDIAISNGEFVQWPVGMGSGGPPPRRVGDPAD